jgi:hypothetical protein
MESNVFIRSVGALSYWILRSLQLAYLSLRQKSYPDRWRSIQVSNALFMLHLLVNYAPYPLLVFPIGFASGSNNALNILDLDHGSCFGMDLSKGLVLLYNHNRLPVLYPVCYRALHSVFVYLPHTVQVRPSGICYFPTRKAAELIRRGTFFSFKSTTNRTLFKLLSVTFDYCTVQCIDCVNRR